MKNDWIKKGKIPIEVSTPSFCGRCVPIYHLPKNFDISVFIGVHEVFLVLVVVLMLIIALACRFGLVLPYLPWHKRISHVKIWCNWMPHCSHSEILIHSDSLSITWSGDVPNALNWMQLLCSIYSLKNLILHDTLID